MELQENQLYVCGSGAYSPRTYTLDVSTGGDIQVLDIQY